jgi:uncharacterized protein (TIGR02391 family)
MKPTLPANQFFRYAFVKPIIMTPAATIELEALCDKEFELVRNEAYEDLDREVAGIRNHLASRGHAMSSVVGQSVLDAVLARYEKVLAGFEAVYLGKWRNTDREFADSDQEWLKTKAMSVLQAEAQEAQSRCNSLLHEPSLFFLGWWQKAGSEARERNNKIIKKIEILKLQKGQRATTRASVPAEKAAVDSFSSIWKLLHPTVVKLARARFESRHYADAAEAVFKEINETVRKLVKNQTGKEYDGANLMQCAFSVTNPILKLDDLGNETGRNIQVGYQQIFSGAMTGIRKPTRTSKLTLPDLFTFCFWRACYSSR